MKPLPVIHQQLGRVQPKPWDKLQEFLPPLSTYELDELIKNIAQHGVLQELLVLPDGRIIDGYHRWKISNGKAPFKVLSLTEDEGFTLGVILNIARRNMTPQQIKQAWKELKKDKEKLRKLALNLRKAGKTQAEVAITIGVPQPTISEWEKNINNIDVDNVNIPDCRIKIPGEEHKKIYARAKSGETQKQIAADYKIVQSRISQIIKKQQGLDEREKKLALAVSKIPASIQSKIILADIKEIPNYLPSGSVNLILTDPPYGKKHFETWGNLAKVASQILKPNGLLISYSGGMFLDKVIESYSQHLEYIWTIALLLKTRQEIYPRQVFTKWKPILIFAKSPYMPRGWFEDVLEGGGMEKDLHDMQQSQVEAEILIEKFSNPNDFVVDPFVGSGTTLFAAKKLNRRWMGFDHDKKAVDLARARLAI